jgi:SAM-dependent methyltransferase
MPINRILTDLDRTIYTPVIDEMINKCPDMMSRKIPRANVQQAFVLDTVRKSMSLFKDIKFPLLCVGSFEDTACATLKASGTHVKEIDPDVNGLDLHKFFLMAREKFDIIFSTSVLEHVKNDTLFIEEICKLLKQGGIAIITTDFKDDYKSGDPLPYSDERFYTSKDITVRLRQIINANDCELVDEPDYTDVDNFVYQGHTYSFATIVFRKKQDV